MKVWIILSTSAAHAALARLGWVSTMPAEWQDRQLAVIASAAAPPGKATSLVGSSTETDFRANVCGALAEAGAEVAAGIGSCGPGWPMNASIRPASTAAPNPT